MKKTRTAVHIFQSVKTDFQKQINELTMLKSKLISSSHETKAKIRMQIETYLIDLNEEMFALSDELAKAFINSH